MDLSLIIPLKNEAESLPELEAWIRRVCESQGYAYEILFIDDGSTDGSWKVITSLQAGNPAVRGIKFRRNYGKSAALQTGFEAALGAVVITMDADLQDSPDEFGTYRMVAEEGFDLVSGWKQKRYDPLSKTIPTKLYMRYPAGWYLAVTRTGGSKTHCASKWLNLWKFMAICTVISRLANGRVSPISAKK